MLKVSMVPNGRWESKAPQRRVYIASRRHKSNYIFLLAKKRRRARTKEFGQGKKRSGTPHGPTHGLGEHAPREEAAWAKRVCANGENCMGQKGGCRMGQKRSPIAWGPKGKRRSTWSLGQDGDSATSCMKYHQPTKQFALESTFSNQAKYNSELKADFNPNWVIWVSKSYRLACHVFRPTYTPNFSHVSFVFVHNTKFKSFSFRNWIQPREPELVCGGMLAHMWPKGVRNSLFNVGGRP